ncbi:MULTISPECIES: ParA family protein [Halorubrum]|jgi:chromosome partitioning protein|uniref:ParA family protein n=4 Tax=Haloferacaceae TaxID=1644056 RepID=A0ABT4Z7E7_HALEZ|nr:MULTISPECIES: ParA family protein [Halorubrum]ELZ37572.1 partition protein [Halorubrum terrestre JCM 10247]MDB2239542.1 ParA family protein [Halorubrum ezzemoulense]MDB2249966.1 ParA family protein [Halorubrum ezzemoulense]MDB2265913.1 ParA family protein [Halorubrum ezzemoulense]MDB2286728.1 ParA family protein [Halorubrum ezzemoulense]
MPQTTETSETIETSPAIVAMLNQKGGVGKTTLTIHVAGALADRELDVLVVDLAPEGALTSILGYDEAYSDLDREVSLHELLLDPSRAAGVENLVLEGEEFDLLPSNERMVDRTGGELNGEPRARERLKMALDELGAGYDVVLVDNMPSINVLTDNALVASDGVLIPAYAEALSVQGLDRLQKQIDSVREYFGTVRILGIVANRVEHNKQADAMLEQLHAEFEDGLGIPVFDVYKRVDLQRAIAAQERSIFAAEELDTDMAEVIAEIAALVDDELVGQAND